MCRDQKQFAGIFVSLCHVDLGGGGGEAHFGRFGGNGLYMLRNSLQEFLSPCVMWIWGGRDKAQVGRFVGNGLYLLSHVTQPPPSDF